MSNQKTTQLRKLTSIEVQPGDLLPIVDVSEITSPTGETKHILTSDFATYIVSGGFLDLAVPYQGLQWANGLAFFEATPAFDDERCYGNISGTTLGMTDFSIFVKAYLSSDFTDESSPRVFCGIGQGTRIAELPNCAYIGVGNAGGGSNRDLIAYFNDGINPPKTLTYTNFFETYTERAFYAGLTKDIAGNVALYANGVKLASGSGVTGTVWLTNNTIVMGNGRNPGIKNLKTTIYEAHIFKASLSDGEASNLFFGGVDTTNPSLVASYNPNALNAGPTQWLDSVGSNHLMVPTSNARATNPGKRFILSFLNDGVSGYLGTGTPRNVLPEKYVLTSCIVESPGKPLLTIGSSNIASYPSASGTGSFRDNRVALVSASYGVNPVGLLALGVGHLDKTLYVYFSASASPCTISFDGYIRN